MKGSGNFFQYPKPGPLDPGSYYTITTDYPFKYHQAVEGAKWVGKPSKSISVTKRQL